MHTAALLLSLVAAAEPAPDFDLRDHRGVRHRLDDWREQPLLVVAFVRAECPLARLYAPRLAEFSRTHGPHGVGFLAVVPGRDDSDEAVADYAHALPFPVLRDPTCDLMTRLGVTRSPEVVVLDRARVVRYRGRIDDQYSPGAMKPRPTEHYLTDAIEQLLANRPVSRPSTEAVGCALGRGRPKESGPVTYCRDVAPILQGHCVRCHRPGQVGPFSLTSYDRAKGHAPTIHEVVGNGRMPPWHADPRYGRFANDASLTTTERRLLLEWIETGCAEGDAADLPPQRDFPSEWAIGKPDLVLALPEPFTVPAEGVIDYQFIEVDPGFREDRWVRAVEVLPTNRSVVHHVNVFLRPPGSNGFGAPGELGSVYLAVYTPGTLPFVFPDGMAKRLPAGWKLVFVMHYAAVGSEQTDQTRLGFRFTDGNTVRQEVASQLMLDEELCIPPHAAGHRVEHARRIDRDVLLLSMFPHMHLRGKSFRYEADYPDGTTEVLLSVPRYDFNWQHRYVLAEPKRLPAGTVLRCTATYDNSAGNPANPDPSATVRTGRQSWDEMFNGYYEVVLADEDLTRRPGRSWVPLLGLGASLLLALCVCWLRRRARG